MELLYRHDLLVSKFPLDIAHSIEQYLLPNASVKYHEKYIRKSGFQYYLDHLGPRIYHNNMLETIVDLNKFLDNLPHDLLCVENKSWRLSYDYKIGDHKIKYSYTLENETKIPGKLVKNLDKIIDSVETKHRIGYYFGNYLLEKRPVFIHLNNFMSIDNLDYVLEYFCSHLICTVKKIKNNRFIINSEDPEVFNELANFLFWADIKYKLERSSQTSFYLELLER